ncbi:hypothetical protein E1293_26745 [Actinomadura darangshiensis]|uniref:Uncharacterized protein n=1 Tax=Actinomadura darangshiensis TaxID=705336 RepID=A0A4R5AWY8_9ACTN|nr:hypothetical protein [Actinomadura darangshiensis]TDD76680.1 hypothetical protein E1293_26745 [Actinomadura darangshiensis]
MAKDPARLREKALKYGRSVYEHLEAERHARMASAAGRAEAVLFRLICGDPLDLGFCSAFGEIADLHSYSASGVQFKGFAHMSGALARAALWAHDRADPSGGDPANVVQAVRESAAVTTDFPRFDGGARDMSPETRVIAAADARLRLAHLLAKQRPGRDKKAMTPDQLNRTLRTRDKFYSSDEELLHHFHTASGVALDVVDEAQALVQEAVEAHRVIGAIGSRGMEDAIRAEELASTTRALLD